MFLFISITSSVRHICAENSLFLRWKWDPTVYLVWRFVHFSVKLCSKAKLCSINNYGSSYRNTASVAVFFPCWGCMYMYRCICNISFSHEILCKVAFSWTSLCYHVYKILLLLLNYLTLSLHVVLYFSTVLSHFSTFVPNLPLSSPVSFLLPILSLPSLPLSLSPSSSLSLSSPSLSLSLPLSLSLNSNPNHIRRLALVPHTL